MRKIFRAGKARRLPGVSTSAQAGRMRSGVARGPVLGAAALAASLAVISALVTGAQGASSSSISAAAASPADAVAALGSSVSYSTVYGGMRLLSNDESNVEVYLTSLDGSTEAAFREAAGPSVSMTFGLVPNSLAAVTALQNRLTAAMTSLRSDGVNVASYGPDESTGKLAIVLTSTAPAAVSRLDDLLGADNVEIQRGSQAVTTTTTTAAAAATGARTLLAHTWHVSSIEKTSAPRRTFRAPRSLSLRWARGPGTGSGYAVTAGCAAANVSILGDRQKFGVFSTTTSTNCAAKGSVSMNRFVYGKLLAGTITWRIRGERLSLSHSGVGRMNLTADQ